MDYPKTRVGVAVIIRKGGKVLLGRRKGFHGEGTWNFPGGHLEFGEKIKDCAKRETKEETGLNIKNVALFTVTNDIFQKENKQYITISVRAEIKSGKLKLMEPDKCEKWD